MSNSKIQLKSHLLFIDSIRALAALYVVIHHSMLQYYDSHFFPYKGVDDYNLPILTKMILNFFGYGNYAVDLFIVVSGFSLMLSVTKNNLSLKDGNIQFYKRRAFRILPPYYIATLFSLILIWLFVGHKTESHWDVSIPVNLNDVIYHILLIHDFWTSTASRINHAFWSIAVECRVYIFFPLMVFIWKKIGAITTLLFSVIVSIIGSSLLYILYKTNTDISLGTGVSPYIILFTLGMIAANLAFSNNHRCLSIRKAYLRISPFIIVMATLAFLCISIVIRHYLRIFNDSHFAEIHLETKVYDVLLGVLFAFILFVCAELSKNNNSLSKILSWRPLVFIGTFSYSLYLIHSPLIALISEYIIKPLNVDRLLSTGLLIIGGCPLILIISYGFFYLFERPFLTMGKKVKSLTIEQEVIVDPAP